MVSARLKGDIEIRPPGIARRPQGLPLSMGTTKPTMKAPTRGLGETLSSPPRASSSASTMNSGLGRETATQLSSPGRSPTSTTDVTSLTFTLTSWPTRFSSPWIGKTTI